MAINNSVNAKVQGFQSLNSTTGVWNGRTLTPGAGIAITNQDGTGGDPVISATSPDVFIWQNEAISYSAVAENGYMSTAVVTGSLPAAGATNGTTIAFIASTSDAHTISPDTTDKIRLASSLSTNGTGGGYLRSTAIGDSIELVYQSSSGIWIALDSVGNWIVN